MRLMDDRYVAAGIKYGLIEEIHYRVFAKLLRRRLNIC